MARTKQTARKSTGGKAPRKQLSEGSSTGFKGYMLSQQRSNSVEDGRKSSLTKGTKALFVNYENTIGEFVFTRPAHDRDGPAFQMHAAAGSSSLLLLDGDSSKNEHWLGLQFTSSLDGAGIHDYRRPRLDICFTIDVSGSMGSPFKGEGTTEISETVSKLEVAKQCIKSVANTLEVGDRAALVIFNHGSQQLLPLTEVTPALRGQLSAVIDAISANGGTNLAEGFQKGVKVLQAEHSNLIERQLRLIDGAKPIDRLQRVIFLTDMESSHADELRVLSLAKTASAAQCPIHTTVIGVDVDLSVQSVEAFSAVIGARYMSVSSMGEFLSTVAEEFLYDVLPTAYEVEVTINGPFTLQRAYGSAELNAMEPDATSFKISSEFPVAVSPEGTVKGAYYFFKLKHLHRRSTTLTKDTSCLVRMSYKDPMGGFVREQSVTVSIPIILPAELERSDTTDEADQACVVHTNSTPLRKAVAVVKYVDVLADYVTSETPEPHKAAEAVAYHRKYLHGFTRLKSFLTQQLMMCHDNSLTTFNINVAQTIDQIIRFESADLAAIIEKAGGEVDGNTSHDSTGSKRKNIIQEESSPAMVCPISLEVMQDPVMAADGHSYERIAIENWLKTHNTSPSTGAILPHTALTPNHALRNAILEWQQQQQHKKQKGVISGEPRVNLAAPPPPSNSEHSDRDNESTPRRSKRQRHSLQG